MTTQRKEAYKDDDWKIARGGAALKPWLVAFTLPVVVIVLGATVFAPVVKTSLQNASHPGLVYGIFVAFVLGVALTALALKRFQNEQWYVNRWMKLASNEERRRWVENNPDHARFTVYPAVSAVLLRMPASERQAKFEHEVRAVESGLADRLVFPNFIAGSLVGLGLVGTFVGLLGTLEDLGAVFGSLAKTGDGGANPTAVFADMVQKLQDPMRGMGTAFVTSLYGLLGSLILGLSSLSVSKMANVIVKDLYSAERLFASMNTEQAPVVRARAGQAESAGWGQIEAVLTQLLESQKVKDHQAEHWIERSEARLTKAVEAMLETNRLAFDKTVDEHQKNAHEMLVALERQTQTAQDFSVQAKEQQSQLAESVRLLAAQLNGDRTMIYRELAALIDKNREEALGHASQLEETLASALFVTERSAQNIERFIRVQQEAVDALPKTGYWRDAWLKVQQFLTQSKQQQDLGKLAQAVERQTLVMHQLAQQLGYKDWLHNQDQLGHQVAKPKET
jgi:hypothetical protein